MVQTNLLKLEFDYENIMNDFHVFEFKTTKDKLYKYSYIDDVKQELKTVSVVYLTGKSFYALFSKKDYKYMMNVLDEFKTIIGEREDVIANPISNLTKMDKRHLAQLLLNSLANQDVAEAEYGNITGKLYYIVDSEQSQNKESGKPIVWKYITLNISLYYHDWRNKKLSLILDVSTFTSLLKRKSMIFKKKKLQEHQHYEIVPQTRKMRRLKQSEYRTSNNSFIIKQVEGARKSIIPFLDFSDYKKFRHTKCGILYKFKKDVDDKLSKYFKDFSFETLDKDEEKLSFNENAMLRKDERIKNFYQTLPTIIDIEAVKDSETDSEKANSIANELISFLSDSEKGYCIKKERISIGKAEPDAINFRFIHNKKYYEGKPDPKYDYQNKNLLIQHLTLEDFEIIPNKRKTSPTLDNLFKELYIKQDIINGRVSIMDWTFENWKFITRQTIESDNENEDPISIFHAVTIDSSGNLIFEKFRSQKQPEYRRYYEIYEEYRNKYKHIVEGIVISPEGDENVIIRTELFTIPDIITIGDNLKKEAEESTYLKERIISMIESLIKNQPESIAGKGVEVDNLLKSLSNDKRSYMSKSALNDAFANVGLSNKTKFKKSFVELFKQTTGDILANFFRSEKEELLYSNIYIQYRRNPIKNSALYFVGEKGNLRSNLAKATIIREVRAAKKNLVFDKLLPTMNVDFVRHGGLTVIPYPFKYLREKIEQTQYETQGIA